jgi:hypothetical protein
MWIGVLILVNCSKDWIDDCVRIVAIVSTTGQVDIAGIVWIIALTKCIVMVGHVRQS